MCNISNMSFKIGPKCMHGLSFNIFFSVAFFTKYFFVLLHELELPHKLLLLVLLVWMLTQTYLLVPRNNPLEWKQNEIYNYNLHNITVGGLEVELHLCTILSISSGGWGSRSQERRWQISSKNDKTGNIFSPVELLR